MKFIFKALATVVVAFILLLGFLYFYTGGMTRVADDFFEAFKDEKYGESNSMLASYVVDDAPSIYGYLRDQGINDIQSTSWHSRNFVNNKGSIAGEVVNGKGETIPARMDFVKQNNDWKIYAIAKQSPKAKLIPNEPTLQQQEALVSQSMDEFMTSAEQKSMDSFHQQISNFWQSQISVAELDKAFASIFNFNGDYSLFSNIKPTIESALIDDDNLLIIDGFYPLNNARIIINQKYIYEATQWKLFSFSYSNEKT